jgi:integrase
MQALYGSLLGWLQARGELLPEAGPAERLTHERFLLYLAARRASLSENTLFNNLRMLAMTLNCLAPGTAWGWLYRHPQAPRRREAAAARRPVRTVRPGAMLAGLLTRLQAMRDARICEASAIRMRDLTIGQSIFRHAGGFEIRFGAAALKNGRPVAIRLMPELTPFLDLHLGSYRPLLLRPGDNAGGALWVSREGNRLAESTAQMAFERITVEVQGQAANPQAFRHSAVTELLNRDPRAMETATALLAHADPTTTGRFYDLSADDAARAHWRALIVKYRPGKGGPGGGSDGRV